MSEQARSIRPAETAKLIRAQLKREFPATKFSVRTDRGGSIRVEWTDGPTSKRIEEILDQYDGKGFDGMIDLAYYIDHWLYKDPADGQLTATLARCQGTEGSLGVVPAFNYSPPTPDAELVHFSGGYHSTTRHVSPDLANRCIAQIGDYYGIPRDEWPVAMPKEPTRWNPNPVGYTIGEATHRRPIPGSYQYDWGSLIHQASGDATRFRRETEAEAAYRELQETAELEQMAADYAGEALAARTEEAALTPAQGAALVADAWRQSDEEARDLYAAMERTDARLSPAELRARMRVIQ